jgi:hypothetical protein
VALDDTTTSIELGERATVHADFVDALRQLDAVDTTNRPLSIESRLR